MHQKASIWELFSMEEKDIETRESHVGTWEVVAHNRIKATIKRTFTYYI